MQPDASLQLWTLDWGDRDAVRVRSNGGGSHGEAAADTVKLARRDRIMRD